MKSKTFRFSSDDEAKFSEVKKKLRLKNDIEVIRFLLTQNALVEYDAEKDTTSYPKAIQKVALASAQGESFEEPLEEIKTIGDPKKLPEWYKPAK